MLPEPTPVPPLPPIEVPTEASARLIVVPPGCPAPQAERAVFTGRLVAADVQTGRFRVEQVRSGQLDGYMVGGLIDIRYGDEVRFLDLDGQYIVGAGVDADSGVLFSRVSPSAPLFGGNDIAGVDDSDVECPYVEDPIRTLTMQGTSVESGVLSPLSAASGDLAMAVLQPLGAAMAVLLALVVLKHLVFAMGRTARDLGTPRREFAQAGERTRPARRPPGSRR